jgi:hypothetical protein
VYTTCTCESVTGAPTESIATDPNLAYWGTATGTVTPPAALPGCTVGMSFVNSLLGNTLEVFACPSSLVLPTAIQANAVSPPLPNCSEPNLPLDQSCEAIGSGIDIESLSVGDVIVPNWTLVASEIVVGVDADAGDDAGIHIHQECPGGCMLNFPYGPPTLEPNP